MKLIEDLSSEQRIAVSKQIQKSKHEMHRALELCKEFDVNEDVREQIYALAVLMQAQEDMYAHNA